jgi:peptidyl-prolyl cis-trans isomerase D
MLEAMRRYQYSWVTILGASFIVLVMTFWGLGAGIFSQVHPVANVNGQRILGDQVEHAANQLRENIQQLYGANAANVLQGVNIRQVALQNIIDDQLVDEEARHLGVSISDQALQDKIASNTAFQHDGQFDFQAYEDYLSARALIASDYESSVRQQMLQQTIRGMIDAGVQVSDVEARHAFDLQHEKIGLRYIEIPYSSFTAKTAPPDAMVAEYYKKNAELFREPERVKIEYVHYVPLALAAQYTPTDKEIQDYYNRYQKSRFTHPDQVSARHILIQVPEGASAEEKAKAKTKAQDVLKQAQSGGDFNKLAAKYSDDPSNKMNGGDLGSFGRGQMIKPFEEAVFAMKPGEITMVETSFGFHVVKLDAKTPAHTDTLAEAKPKIIEGLRSDAGARASRDAIQQDVTAALGGANLEDLAKKRGLESAQTPALSANDSIKGAEQDRELIQSAFKLDVGQVRAVPGKSGAYLVKLLEKQPARIPPLKEIEAKVRDALIRVSAEQDAHNKAEKVLAEIKSPADFDKVAASNALTVKSVDPIVRSERSVPGIGAFPEVTDAAGAVPTIPGVIDHVMDHEGNFYIFEVTSRTQPSDEQWASAKKSFNQELLAQRRQQAWQSFVDQLTRQAKISIDTDQLGGANSGM